MISTGGSNLSAATSAPNTGRNWTETAWSCATPVACQNTETGTGGGGGGASGSAYSSTTPDSFAGFAAPAYQVGIDDAPFKGNAKRLVPDIAADGDPTTGFTIYTSDPQYDALGTNHDVEFGGTSLASPISAAQLTNALSDAGRTTGVGDIHNALYSAYHQTRSLAATNAARPFRDITSGQNGAVDDKGTDPSVKAQAGFDTVSGVGGVLWPALLPWLFDTSKPAITTAISEPSQHTGSWRTVKASWRASTAAHGSLIRSTTVRITADGVSRPVYSATVAGAAGSRSFTATPGTTYVVTAWARNLSGGTSAARSSTVVVPIDSSKFAVSKGWHTARSAADIAGTHLTTTAKGATARVTGFGRTFAVQVITTRSSGKVGVYLSGKLIKTLNLYSKKSGRRSMIIYSNRSRRHHTFTFRVLGTKSAKSRSHRIALDALHVSY